MRNRRNVFLAALVIFLAMPLAALAMSHEKHEHGSHEMKHDMKKSMEHMKHGSMEGHGGMEMHGDMVMLGDHVVEGVKGMAHLKDVEEAMAKMGMKETHHFMIMFMNTETGKPIEEGLAAVKITSPSGQTGDPIKLVGMQGHFGADVVLDEPGTYVLEVGTKLADGQKRQYEFDYVVE